VARNLTKYGIMFTLIVPVPMAGIIPWLITRWQPQPALFGIEPLRWLGMLMIPVGLVVYALALSTFEREDARAYPPCVKIVSSSIYGRTRNPMYLGVLLIMYGEALWLGSLGLVIYATGWFVFFHVFEVTFDEPFLKKKFGEEYTKYHESTPRWIPRGRRT
jgi:protein-S-isoprenylcysteine O-methyltransferase Ste14